MFILVLDKYIIPSPAQSHRFIDNDLSLISNSVHLSAPIWYLPDKRFASTFYRFFFRSIDYASYNLNNLGLIKLL